LGAVRFLSSVESVAGLTIITWSASFAFLEMLKILDDGSADRSAGAQHGLLRCTMHFVMRSLRINRRTLRIYAEGRHEMLNVTNRDEMTSDIIDRVRTCF
jgi:hypothetical protein